MRNYMREIKNQYCWILDTKTRIIIELKFCGTKKKWQKYLNKKCVSKIGRKLDFDQKLFIFCRFFCRRHYFNQKLIIFRGGARRLSTTVLQMTHNQIFWIQWNPDKQFKRLKGVYIYCLNCLYEGLAN